jgi:hypothetical protein
MVDRRERKDV